MAENDTPQIIYTKVDEAPELASASLLPIIRRNPALKAEITNKAGTIAFLQFNHLHPPFDNEKVRRAVLMAVASVVGGIWGTAAEGRSLEDVSKPLAAV